MSPSTVEDARTGERALRNAGRPPSTAPAVEFAEAAVRRGGRLVWRDVSLKVEPGEFVAILGPNGAGKSTLLKALLGVIPLAEGSVRVFGRAVRRGNAQVGYLPQRRRYDRDLRIRGVDLVRLGLDGGRFGVPLPSWVPTKTGRSRQRAVAAMLELVGAAHYAQRPIGELSGGEQQRLLIAQALVAGARMLALDEPLESLDLSNQTAVSGLIQRICRQQGITVLLVAHDVNPILPFVDRVVYAAAGRVVTGQPTDVIRAETLSALYGVPVEVLRTADGRVVVVAQREPVTYHAEEH